MNSNRGSIDSLRTTHHLIQRARTYTSPADSSTTTTRSNSNVTTGSPPLKDVSFVPDSMSSVCFACQSTFTFTKRKHHCRCCGNVLCSTCSSKKIVLPSARAAYTAALATGQQKNMPPPPQPVRVCDSCHAMQFQREHLRSMRRPSLVPTFSTPSILSHQTTTPASAASVNHPMHRSSIGSVSEDLQPCWDQDIAFQSGSGSDSSGGWGTNIEAGGRWFSSFFFNETAVGPTNNTSTTTPISGTNGPSTTTDDGTQTPTPDQQSHNLTLHINPNHIESAAVPPNDQSHHHSLDSSRTGSLSLLRSPMANPPVGNMNHHHHHPLLTPDQHKQFTLLLFNTYLCVSLQEEKIKLQEGNIMFHMLPKKHLDCLTNEIDVDEQLSRKAMRYLHTIQSQVRRNREEWMKFMSTYDYENESSADDSPHLPPFLSYPATAPPFCSGTIIISNFQFSFIPDYVILIYWSHVLATEERRRWKWKRIEWKKRKQRTYDRDNITATGIPATSTEPPMTHSSSASPSPSPSPDSNNNSDATTDRIVPAAAAATSSMVTVEDSISEDQDSPIEGLESAIATPLPGATPASSPPPSHLLSPPLHSPPPNTLLSASTNLTGSITPGSGLSNSSIFARYHNQSNFHLPHYRLYQIRIQGISSGMGTAAAANGSHDTESQVEFDPLLFAPPFVSLPLLSIRKLKSSSFDSKDLGVIELKTKFHHGPLRFILCNVVKKQRFTAFKNLGKCIEYYTQYQPPQPGQVVIQTKLSHITAAAANGPQSPTNNNTNFQLSEIAQKVFAFRQAAIKAQGQGQSSYNISPLSPNSSSSNSHSDKPNISLDLGWTLYDPIKEFIRQGVLPSTTPTGPPLPGQSFRVTQVNYSYTFCPSYPRILIVPSYISDDSLTSIASFRSKKRIPTVSWSGILPSPPIAPIRAIEDGIQEMTQSGIKSRRALLLRSAQPLTGLTGQRCAEDEMFLQHACAAIGTDRLLIIDCRPMANAIGQAALGAGYENASLWYTPSSGKSTSVISPIREAQIQFLQIENIHVVRKSHSVVEKMITKLIEDEQEMEHAGWRTDAGVRIRQDNTQGKSGTSVSIEIQSPTITSIPVPPVSFPTAHPSAAGWLTALHASGHYSHLTNILAGANQVLSCLSQGIAVLVHCSDGWDRTAILTSLSQLALDSYYRTIEGFLVLIEKEWLSFGHRFSDRLGHGHYSQEVSPIMLQFLDCVYQYLHQFPTSFQFDSRLLVYIHYHLYSGYSGTFLFNSEEERHRNNAKENTRSAWTYVMEHTQEFSNPVYGLGWTDVSRPMPPSKNQHTSFGALPLYADSSTLFIDTKSLVFFDDLYFQSRRPLTWNWNLIHKENSTLSSLDGAGTGMISSTQHHPQRSATTLVSCPENPALDLNPVSLYLDALEKQEQLEDLHLRFHHHEVEACIERMVATIERREVEDRLLESLANTVVQESISYAYVQLSREWMANEIELRVTQAKKSHFISVEAEHENHINHQSTVLSTNRTNHPLSIPQITNGGSSTTHDRKVQPRNLFGSSASPSSYAPPSLGVVSAPSNHPLGTLNSVPIRIKNSSDWAQTSATTCHACRQPFSMIRWAHHCRVCAATLCDSCSPKVNLLVERVTTYKSGRGDAGDRLEPEKQSHRVCLSCQNQLVRTTTKPNASDSPHHRGRSTSIIDRGSQLTATMNGPAGGVPRAQSLIVGSSSTQSPSSWIAPSLIVQQIYRGVNSIVPQQFIPRPTNPQTSSTRIRDNETDSQRDQTDAQVTA